MRKLILVEFEGQTGPTHVFKGYRLAVVNNGPEETEEDLLVKAGALFERQFSDHFPQSTILSIMPYATWGEGAVMPGNRNNDSALHFTNFHSMDEHPEEIGNEGYSDDVLIDLDGWRKEFRIGYYDTENDTWYVYWHALDGDETELDMKHGRWTHLPLNKEKIEEKEPSEGDVTHAVNSIMNHFKGKDTSGSGLR